jgi:glycosyltransferase involved in cell wall biosynthesis
MVNVTTKRFDEQPLVSVFTPTYLTDDKIKRPHQSLLAQTYPNWEWIIYDDSPDAGRTFEQMAILGQADQRISAFRADRPNGCIGEVKRRACGLTRGPLLLELDHDDELTPNALRDLVDAHLAFPDAGFFYSDCAEVFESGKNATYREGWAFGYGSYRQETFRGHAYQVTNYPDINSRTLRHIVGVPNHFRAWTRDAYQAAGGHNPEVHVCDDYELLLRTFLVTRFVHIRKFGYIQYHNNASSGNTQFNRNAEIQRLVRYFRNAYNEKIHQRMGELGVDDFLWQEGGQLDWKRPDPSPGLVANYVYP